MDVAGRRGGGGEGRRERKRRRRDGTLSFERKGDGARAQRGLAPASRDGGREVLDRLRLGTVFKGLEHDGELSGGRGGGGRRGEEEEEEEERREGDEDDDGGNEAGSRFRRRRRHRDLFFFRFAFPKREGNKLV